MPLPSMLMIDLFSEALLTSIVTGDPSKVVNVLSSDNAQRMVRQVTLPPPHYPPFSSSERYLRNVVKQLRHAVTVGPWATSPLPALLGRYAPGLDSKFEADQSPLMGVIGGFDQISGPLRGPMANVLLPLVMPWCDPNEVGKNGRTPLEQAIRVGLTAAFELLLPITNVGAQANPTVDAQLLLSACQFGTVDMVSRLLERPQIPQNTIDEKGQGPLHKALLRQSSIGDRSKIVEALLPTYDAWTVDHLGHTPLSLALLGKDSKRAALIIASYGTSPTPRAARYQRLSRAYKIAVDGEHWDMLGLIASALPEAEGRRWLIRTQQQNVLLGELVETTKKAERVWEERALREALDRIAPEPVPKPVRARL